jgi:hypothetical protein
LARGRVSHGLAAALGRRGAKGPRLYDWAYLPYRSDTAPGWKKGLLIRRKRAKPDAITFYLTLSPDATSVRDLAAGDLRADLLPHAVAEVRRLLWRLVWQPPPDHGAALAWSRWRRRHRQRARQCHWNGRTKADELRL